MRQFEDLERERSQLQRQKMEFEEYKARETAKLAEERREIEELRNIYNKKLEQMERDEYEEDLERAANRKLMDDTMRSTFVNGPDGHLQPPTPKRKVKVRKVRR